MARKKFISDFFFQLNFFWDFFFRFINIVCLDKIQKSLIFQEKTAKFELSHHKKVLDKCSSTLKFSLVKYVHISILVRSYYI